MILAQERLVRCMLFRELRWAQDTRCARSTS